MARHEAVTQILKFFDSKHLPAPLRDVAQPIETLAKKLADSGSGAELTIGLRKLLEAKDCFVRARLHEMRVKGEK